MDVEQHRTLLSAADLEGSRQMLGRCTVTTVDTTFGPAGMGLVLPGSGADEDDPRTTGWRITSPVGRFNQVHTWDGTGDRSRARAVEAMIFPNLNKTHTMVTWDGQNFAAFCTEWENQNSPLVNLIARPAPTPIVDACGVVVGYYLKKVSTKLLFATDNGEIFYTAYVLSHPTYTVNTRSIAGEKIFITPADQPVYFTGKIGGYKSWMRGDKWADVLLDIDGFVVAIDMYGDEKPKSWAQKYNEAVEGVPLLGWIMPRIPIPPSDKCFGEVDEDMVGYEAWEAQCSAEMTGFFADSMFLILDMVTLGESKAARKLLSIGRKALAAGSEKAEEMVLRRARATAVALTLELNEPEVKGISRAAGRTRSARRAAFQSPGPDGLHPRVKGKPDASVPADKAREIHQANRFAEREDVVEVHLGESAKKTFQSPRAEPFPDVVAKKADGTFAVAEGKGTRMDKAITQFEAAGKRLPGRISEQEVVVPKLVDQPVDGGVLKSPGAGYGVDQQGFLLDATGHVDLKKGLPPRVLANGVPIKVIVLP
jgi:hypothetical protein